MWTTPHNGRSLAQGRRCGGTDTGARHAARSLQQLFRAGHACGYPRDDDGQARAALDTTDIAHVAVHGWSHTNYATEKEKKQELGSHRDLSIVLDELQSGLEKLHDLHGRRFVPMLVPPWNRIDANVVQGLADLGYRALSVFGPEKDAVPPCLNTHVDVIDWHGSRGGREDDILFAETAARILQTAEHGGTTGILTHHLVHDDNVWRFLKRLFEITGKHPAARWRSSAELINQISP